MPRPWTKEEIKTYKQQLVRLYVTENKSIREIAEILNLSDSGVFVRLKKLDIKTTPHKKLHYQNHRNDIVLPAKSRKLAELFGILLGDGHVSHYQTTVTLGTKELEYVEYVRSLMGELFSVEAKACQRKNGYRDVYIGSTKVTKWLRSGGLTSNKVATQVDIPDWITSKKAYMRAFIRGFFDTDGSIYKLRHGRQISFTNHSAPLLQSLHGILFKLGYKPSRVCGPRIYLTKSSDVDRFFREVKPANQKHVRRYKMMRR